MDFKEFINEATSGDRIPMGPGGLGRGLSAQEGKIAAMRAAGASIDAIALLLECPPHTVALALDRPRVAQQVLILTAMMGREMAPAIKDVNEAIEAAASEAFQVNLENMRELHELGRDGGLRHQDKIKAKVSASAIAQDILDRAGKRAPTRVVTVSGKIPEAAMEHLANVVKEVSGNEGAIDVTTPS